MILELFSSALNSKRDSLLTNLIKDNKINKLNIIGRPGSGKTKISKKLRRELETDLLNIDSLYEEIKDDFQIKEIIVNKLTASKKIIIDGTYVSLLTPQRIDNTDLFVIVNSSILNSIFKVANTII